jgi:hypothetical protein
MGQPGTPQPQSALSYLGKSDSVLDFVGRFLSIKQHQQAQAGEQLQSAITLAQSGFPIDVKAFGKMVKKSKLPIATDDETLRAFYDTEIANKRDGKTVADPMSMMKGQPKPMEAQPGSPDYVKSAVDAHNRITSSGKALSPGEMMGQYMNVLAGRARQMMSTKAATDQEKANNELHIEGLRGQAMQGDNQARGRLMAMGNIPINVEFEKWNAMTDTQKKGMFDIMAGHESDAERAARGQRIGESLVTSGRLTDPASAYRMGDILASGGQVPADLRAQVKPYTFSEMADQATLGEHLIQMGVPPGRIGSVMRAATAGGLENAMPTGLKPIAVQQLGLEQARLGMEQLRYAKEIEIAKRATAVEANKALSEQSKADLQSFKDLVELKKMGGNIPPDLLKGAQIKAATALNMDVKEVDSFWHFLTGGTNLEFSPHLSDEGKGTVDKFSGKAQPSKKSTLDKIGDTIKRMRTAAKEPI